MSRRAGIPMRSASSTISPHETMAASQQAHIDELVQRNRTFENTIQKLNEELSREQSCSKDTVKQIQAQWHAERVEWREGCDTLLACHRIVQLRTAIELDKERLAAAKEEDVARKETLARLQRDYKITMFQIRELELEAKVAELEGEMHESKEQFERDMQELAAQHQVAVKKLKEKCANVAAEATFRADELAAVEKEKSAIESNHSRLREEYAQLRVTADSTSSKLERVTLQLDGAQTANAELNRVNDDLKRNIVDIKRQLDKWQNLETKGEAEVVVLRKRRIELEVNVKELESRLSDAEKTEEANAKALENQKRKVDKLKAALAECRQATTDAEGNTEKLQEEVATAQKQTSKAQKQIDRLKTELEVERARVRPASPKKMSPSATPSEDEVVLEIQQSISPDVRLTKERPKSSSSSRSDGEQIEPEARKPTSRTRPRPKPAYKGRKGTAADEDEGKEPKAGPSRVNKIRVTSNPQSDIEEAGGKAGDIRKTKTKGKANGKAKAVEKEDDDVKFVGVSTKPNGKRKASMRVDNDSEVEEVLDKKIRRKDTDRDVRAAERSKVSNGGEETFRKGEAKVASRQDRDVTKAKRSKALSSRPGSVQPEQIVVEDDDDDEGQAAKKKKRKINIFGPAQESTFTWANADNGLNIPTILSPVKETEAVPSRSNSSMLGKMGSALANSFRR